MKYLNKIIMILCLIYFCANLNAQNSEGLNPLVKSSTLKGFSMGSAHPNDVRKLKRISTGPLAGVDLHVHNWAFIAFGTNSLRADEIPDLMYGRTAWTTETDQACWGNGYEINYFNNVKQYTNANCLNQFITLRSMYWSWDESTWSNYPNNTTCLPGELLQKTNINDSRAVAHYYPNQLFTSSWTPYQQRPDMDWGKYININGGLTFDMGDPFYWLTDHVPPPLAAVGWNGANWKAHIKCMFNMEQGQKVIAMNFSTASNLNSLKQAITSMLNYGLNIDYIIVENFSGAEFQGDYIANYANLASWLKTIVQTAYTLNITSGTGSGNYTVGTTITITANAAPTGKVFDKWTIISGNPIIADVNAASTTLSMPNSAVTVTATYKNAGSDLSAIMTCDNSYELYLNGTLVGSGNNWMQAQNFANLNLQNGKNVIAVKAMDAGGIAGFLAELKLNGQKIETNSNWKVSLSAPTGWNNLSFNDASWLNATEYGAYGVNPWGKNVSGMPSDSKSKWIWSSDAENHNTVYFRFVIQNGSSTNIALNKPSSQSSTAFEGVSLRAVDGNTDGSYWNNSVTHTDLTAAPWWKVDLGGNYSVNSVILWNRTDACSERLSNFHVDYLNQAGTVIAKHDYPGIAGIKTVINSYANGVYAVRVQLNGSNYLSLAEVEVMGIANFNSSPTAISEETVLQAVELSQNYPNPFNLVTTISFALPNNGNVKLAVMNTKGETVKVLASGNYQTGNHSFDFDGSGLNSGVYFYRLTTPEKTITKKMIMCK